MERMFDLKFIVPPLITIILVGVFIFLIDPNGILFSFVWLREFQSLAVAIGSAIILALGFLISSITTLCLKIDSIRKRLGQLDYDGEEPKNLNEKYPYIGKEDTFKTRESFENDCACEVAEWQILKEKGFICL